MKVAPLFLEAAALLGANLVVELDHTDLTEATAATAQLIPLFNVLANKQSVECVRLELIEPFQDTADAANNTTSVTIGDDGSANRLLTATELNVNGTEVFQKAGTGTKHIFSADNTVDITFAAPAAGKTLLALNKGKLRAYFILRDSRE